MEKILSSPMMTVNLHLKIHCHQPIPIPLRLSALVHLMSEGIIDIEYEKPVPNHEESDGNSNKEQ